MPWLSCGASRPTPCRPDACRLFARLWSACAALPAAPELHPAEALAALKTTEAELTALGGSYDPDLAAAIGLVNGVFPGARLIRLQ
jgi:hypothetical protein